MLQDYTHITALLDRSGSMKEKVQDTVGGFAQFVKEQASAPGRATLTLVQFDDVIETVYDFLDIKEVPSLVMEPRGYTAYLDALGQTIIKTGDRLRSMNEEDRPAHVIFIVMTDGLENASRNYSRADIAHMIKLQEEVYKWQFVFLGANMNAIHEGASIGVSHARAANYDDKKVRATYQVVSKNLVGVRTGKKSTMDFDENDRKALK